MSEVDPYRFLAHSIGSGKKEPSVKETRTRLDEIEDRIIREWHSTDSPTGLLRAGLLESFRHGVEQAATYYRVHCSTAGDIQPAPAEEKQTVDFSSWHDYLERRHGERRRHEEVREGQRWFIPSWSAPAPWRCERRSFRDRRKPADENDWRKCCPWCYTRGFHVFCKNRRLKDRRR